MNLLLSVRQIKISNAHVELIFGLTKVKIMARNINLAHHLPLCHNVAKNL
jgi:hypothetical protein